MLATLLRLPCLAVQNLLLADQPAPLTVSSSSAGSSGAMGAAGADTALPPSLSPGVAGAVQPVQPVQPVEPAQPLQALQQAGSEAVGGLGAGGSAAQGSTGQGAAQVQGGPWVFIVDFLLAELGASTAARAEEIAALKRELAAHAAQ